jgi:hypothetical protein
MFFNAAQNPLLKPKVTPATIGNHKEKYTQPIKN